MIQCIKEFNSWNMRGERKQQIHPGCPLTSTCMLWHLHTPLPTTVTIFQTTLYLNYVWKVLVKLFYTTIHFKNSVSKLHSGSECLFKTHRCQALFLVKLYMNWHGQTYIWKDQHRALIFTWNLCQKPPCWHFLALQK